MKRFLSVLLVGMLVISLAACGGNGNQQDAPTSTDDQQATDTATEDGDTIVIGGLAPLNGEVSEYGIASNNGALLAVEEINAAGGILGKQIEYIYEDEQGDATEAIAAYNKLVQNDGIIALVGDVTTKPTIAVAQLAADDYLPMITPTATGESVTTYGENIFRACFIDPYQGELMANYAFEKLGAKKVAVIYDNGDDYSAGVAEAFEETAKELGMEVVATEAFSSGTVDFNAQLTKIKETEPDAIMVPTYYADASKIIIQGRSIGLDVPMMGSDGWDGVLGQVDESDFDKLHNTYFCSQYSPQSEDETLQNFLATYLETYGEEVNMFGVLGYDAMHMMAQAIEDAGSTDAQAIVEAMANLEYTGLTGKTVFDENRNPVREAYITVFDGGESTVKETYNFK